MHCTILSGFDMKCKAISSVARLFSPEGEQTKIIGVFSGQSS